MTEVKEIKDPEGLLDAYEQAKKDLVALRRKNKDLTEKVETLSSHDMRKRALHAETKLALQGQGIKDVDRLMPYIGTDGLDFDETGQVSGLTERMESLKKDLPEIFDPKVRAGGKADIHANSAVEANVDPLRAAVRRAVNS